MATNTNTAYLLIGSNLGERAAYLKQACALIEKKVGKIVESSKLYETQAWGKTNQPDFLNQALAVATPQSPSEVLKNILSIEAEMGRTRAEKWEERTIDIDILLFNDWIVDEPNLTIPHPHLHERNFALIPLMEIAGEVEHPVLKLTIEDVYFDCTDPLDVFVVD